MLYTQCLPRQNTRVLAAQVEPVGTWPSRSWNECRPTFMQGGRDCCGAIAALIQRPQVGLLLAWIGLTIRGSRNDFHHFLTQQAVCDARATQLPQ